jgi:ribose transport system permease protein
MTYVILMGGIDLTVGGIISITGIVTSFLLARVGLPMAISILIGVLLSIIIGIINGLIITLAKMPPFIVTLGMSFICKGFTYIISGGRPISITNNEYFNMIGNGYFFFIPLPIIYMLVFFVVLSYVLNQTRLGRHIYAIGGNIEAAKYSGINVLYPQIIAYALIGLLSGLCGIIIVARLYSGQPTIGTAAEMDAIAAVILGGASLSGGSGTIGGSFLGAIIMGTINNGLNLLGVNSYWQNVAKGVVIILAVFIDVMKRTRTEKMKIKTSKL